MLGYIWFVWPLWGDIPSIKATVNGWHQSEKMLDIGKVWKPEFCDSFLTGLFIKHRLTIYNYFIKVCSSIFLKVCLANILFSYCSAPLKSIKAKWSSYKHFFTWILLVSLDSIIAYFQLNLLDIPTDDAIFPNKYQRQTSFLIQQQQSKFSDAAAVIKVF